MNWDDAQGTPIACAVIVLVAVVALFGLSFAFSGSVQF